jgi:tRNA threonylcarbamoyladenosine biosynthesis protein TsaE
VTAATALAIDLADEAATAALGARLAGRARIGDVIALSGPLGSGKTCFARGFIRAFGDGAEEVPSPTFTLVEVYAFAGRPPVWHFDLYRLKAPDEVWELGIEDALAEGICLVEWPERLGSLLPEEHLGVALASGATPQSRRAELSASPSWTERLAGIEHV